MTLCLQGLSLLLGSADLGKGTMGELFGEASSLGTDTMLSLCLSPFVTKIISCSLPPLLSSPSSLETEAVAGTDHQKSIVSVAALPMGRRNRN